MCFEQRNGLNKTSLKPTLLRSPSTVNCGKNGQSQIQNFKKHTGVGYLQVGNK